MAGRKSSGVNGLRGTAASLLTTLWQRLPRLNGAVQEALPPVLRIGERGPFVVTGYHAARDVLARRDEFLAGPTTGPKLYIGPFPLGMDPGTQYTADRRMVGAALMRDISVEHVLKLANKVRRKVPEYGCFDVIESYGQLIPTHFVANYFGLPLPSPGGAPELATWLRQLVTPIAMNHPAPPWVRRGAERARSRLMQHLHARLRTEIDAQERPRRPSETALGAFGGLIRSGQASFEDASRILAGTIVTANAVVIKAFAHVLRYWLRHPEVLERGRKYAIEANSEATRALILETLRFDPVFPMLSRHAARATVLAPGTRDETPVPAGSSILIGVLGACFDPAAIEEPGVFDETRWFATEEELLETPVDLTFSYGMHRCPASSIALTLLTGMLFGIVELPKLRRPTRGGRLRYWCGTPAVKSLRVEVG